MNYQELKAFLHLLMVSDPWPHEEADNIILETYANEEARDRGYSDWIEAFHKM